MSEARQLLLQMEHAEERGDHQSARALARTILASGERPIEAASEQAEGAQPPSEFGSPADPRASTDGDEALAQVSARELLLRTEPDPFLFVVGIVGLGLLVWLVYNYVL